MTNLNFKEALQWTSPVMVSYVLLGTGFGIAFSQELHYPWYFASFMGVWIYSGAAQFLTVGILATGGGLLEVLLPVLILNGRHIFYSFSMLGKLEKVPFKPYTIFTLTDETYSVFSVLKPGTDGKVFFQVSLFNHLAWILGCTAGAYLGSLLNQRIEGVNFLLVALFTVASIEQLKQIKRIWPAAFSVMVFFASYQIMPEHALFVSMAALFAFVWMMKGRLDVRH